MNNPKTVSHPSSGWAGRIALLISVATLLFALGTRHKDPTRVESAKDVVEGDALTRIRKTGVLKVGYGGFPPYTIINPNESDPQKRITGYSVELLEEIAKRHVPPLKIEWHNFNWDTLKVEMESKKFDIVIEPVFQTVPRAIDFGLCEPYGYFGIAVAVVKKGDKRFKSFSDLDNPNITIALADGWTSSEYAKRTLIKPKFKYVTVEKDAYSQCDEVILGRADVALNDVPTVLQYVKAHPDKVEALWIENPPSVVAGGFLTRKNERELREFLDASVRTVKLDGVLNRLDKKWKALGYTKEEKFHPGPGLED